MIKIKETKLYNIETEEFVENSANNRLRALFCTLIDCEARKPYKDESFRLHRVKDIAKICHDFLSVDNVNNHNKESEFKSFVRGLDAVFYLNELKEDQEFIKLANDVWNDQFDKKTEAHIRDFLTLIDDYQNYDEKIFGKQKEKEM